ncbi:MAG TPA: hypothetical protein HPP77_05295 [Candidatus Hydrogenedentes bacterium]|nr:hypothetical protein [Candidatus Hydrogenedentota bacterium]
MTILFDPDLGEEERWAEALPLYEALVEDFADWPTHHDVMVAKIHLGDLYCELQGDEGASKAEELYWSAIDVAEENIVFDDPDFTHLNVESIARASAPVGRRLAEDGSLMVAPTEEMNAKHRQGLLALRKGWTEALRRSAVRALAFKKYDPELPDISIARLTALKKQRIDDALFQNALDSLIEDLATSSAARQDDSWTRPLLDAITEEESKPEATEE